jgi:hypothetical protein
MFLESPIQVFLTAWILTEKKLARKARRRAAGHFFEYAAFFTARSAITA